MQNTFGKYFRLTVTGSSHGEYVGGVLENCPKGLSVDYDLIRKELDRRRPNKFGTERKEADIVEFLSGIKENITSGEKIEFRVANKNVKKQDYDSFQGEFRPSHADYTYYIKYSKDDLSLKDMASARMFLPVVVAGCFAKMFLQQNGVEIKAEVSQIGGIDYLKERRQAENLLERVKQQGDSIGGRIKCVISGIKSGIGEPIFEKISAVLAYAMFSIPSVTSFSIGDILNRENLSGSEDIDEWYSQTNHSGGINAGITNGNPIVFTIGLHAVHTLSKEMTLMNKNGELIRKKIGGRHDVCQVLRTPVIVENMVAILLMDYIFVSDKQQL